MSDFLTVPAHDGRSLEVLTAGDPDGFPWLFINGTPTAATPSAQLHRVATDLGLRLVTWSRPGYGGSTPWSAPGATIADDVTDAVTVLDHLGIGEFVTLGWSGGGPRALACAALLPGRCRAVATLAGIAPYTSEGLDWFDGMAPENVEDFTLAATGDVEAYQALLEETMPPMFSASPADVAAAFGQLVTPVDAAALTGEFAEFASLMLHRAGEQGVVGVRDDGLALVAPWGFDLGDIAVPVAIWQGRQDAMVPYGHGAWLANHVPGAEAHLFEDEGHLSLAVRMDTILADLKRLGGVG